MDLTEGLFLSSLFENSGGGGGGDGGGGGGNTPKEWKDVNFIDYDGTLIESYTAQEASALSALPSNPSHSGLTSQGWNYTLAQVKNEATAQGGCIVGQMYLTSSEDTEIDIRLDNSARKSPYFNCGVNGEITINWGDNTSTTVTGTNLATVVKTQHVYANAGDYTIIVHVVSGTCALRDGVLGNNSSTANSNRLYTNCVKAVRIGKNTQIRTGAFQYCTSLKYVTIPDSVTSEELSTFSTAFSYCQAIKSVTVPNSVSVMGSNWCERCYSLESVSIPTSVTTFAGAVFTYCYSLSRIIIPSSVTSVGDSVFQYCQAITDIKIPSGITALSKTLFQYAAALTRVTIPNTVTSINTSTFNTCYALASLTVPGSVTSIGANAFANNYGMAEYHFQSTTVPTLGTTAFSNIPSDCKIYVPSAKLSDYKSAQNWSTYASYMQGE